MVGGGRGGSGGTGGRPSAGGSAGGSAGARGNITVWLAGDSTMANGETPCPVGWGKVFDPLFDERVKVTNSAAGGRPRTRAARPPSVHALSRFTATRLSGTSRSLLPFPMQERIPASRFASRRRSDTSSDTRRPVA